MIQNKSIQNSIFLVHYGELGLKGKNRSDFEHQLRKNIQSKLKLSGINSSEFCVDLKHRYIQIQAQTKPQIIQDMLTRTFGIAWFAHVQNLSKDSNLNQISKELIKLANKSADPQKSFKIKCKRANKKYAHTSPEIETYIGNKIQEHTKYCTVDFDNPDITLYIEINSDQIYIFDNKQRGLGGLPVGSSGKVLMLLSGGIDSPVAAYQMAKRGCAVDLIHFYVNKPKSQDKIVRLSRHISKYTHFHKNKTRLFIVPYLPFNMAILDFKTKYELVLFRRFMLRIAEKLAQEQNIDAIATGDSLGQVASQTISNITAANNALKNKVCFRPLITYDKQEIVNLAKKIQSFNISNEPHKDCCSIIDKHAKTRVDLKKIENHEKKIPNYHKIVKETFSQIKQIQL